MAGSRRDALKKMNEKKKEQQFGLMNNEPNNVITDLAKNADAGIEEESKISKDDELQTKNAPEEQEAQKREPDEKKISKAVTRKENKIVRDVAADDNESINTTIYITKKIYYETIAIGELAEENKLQTEDGSKLNRAEFIRMALENEIARFYKEYPKAEEIVKDMIKEKKELENKKKKRIL